MHAFGTASFRPFRDIAEAEDCNLAASTYGWVNSKFLYVCLTLDEIKLLLWFSCFCVPPSSFASPAGCYRQAALGTPLPLSSSSRRRGGAGPPSSSGTCIESIRENKNANVSPPRLLYIFSARGSKPLPQYNTYRLNIGTTLQMEDM